MLKRIRTFLKLNPKTKLLFLEAYLQLGKGALSEEHSLFQSGSFPR